jgi:hypothetical protein
MHRKRDQPLAWSEAGLRERDSYNAGGREPVFLVHLDLFHTAMDETIGSGDGVGGAVKRRNNDHRANFLSVRREDHHTTALVDC